MTALQKISRTVSELIRSPDWAELFRWKVFGAQMIWHRRINRRFDARYGTDTAAEGLLVDWGVSRDQAVQGNEVYRPLWEDLFVRIMRKIAPLGLGDYSFLDLGSGKGKLLLLATKWGFKAISGIEYVPQMNEIANRNVELFRSVTEFKMPVQSILGDATDFEMPIGPVVLFVFNSFQPETMKIVYDNIACAVSDSPHPVFLIYANVRSIAECPTILEGRQEMGMIASSRQYIILGNQQATAAWRRTSGKP